MANGNFGGGDGTELTPFLVEDAYDLNAVRNNLSAHYKQTADIDLNIYSTGDGWIPIGQETVEFTGVYDGDGYEIRNLWCNNLVGNNGMFGSIKDGAKLKNILLKNTILARAGDYTGGLVGGCENLSENAIVNCHVTGIINELNINKRNIGGLIGVVNSANTTTIDNCSFEGQVFSSYASTASGHIGGLIGRKNTNLLRCWSKGSVIAPGTAFVGGLVGSNLSGNCGYSYSLCDVQGSIYVGGFIGNQGVGTTLNCWSRGNVQGNGYVGGFIGGQSTGSPIINRCYSTGFVQGDSDVGGFCGRLSGGTIENSVWDIETSGQITSQGGIGKTTEEMKNKQTYLDMGWVIV